MGDFEYPSQKANFYSYISTNRDLIKISEEPSGIISGFAFGHITNQQKARIRAIFVESTWRNKGTGTKLLKSLESEFLTRNPSLTYLSVRIPEEYFTSQPFFENLNFEIVTKINGYVTNNLSFPFSVNNQISVRKAKKSDIESIMQVEKECFSKFWQIGPARFAQMINEKTEILFVALLNNKVLGYNFNTVSHRYQSGNYVRIATLPEYRQKNIATTLTAHAFKWFQSMRVKEIILSTYADSSFHNSMYQKWGFSKYEEEIILAREY